jgi:hypothetical protein
MKIFQLLLIMFALSACGRHEIPKDTCTCEIPEITDTKTIKDKSVSTEGWQVQPEASLTADIQKSIEAKIKIAGGYAQSDTLIQEVFSAVLAANPQITQKANLYRSVTCALYILVCRDTSLSQTDKTRQLREVLVHYEQKIDKILGMDADKQGSQSGSPVPINAPGTTSKTPLPAPAPVSQKIPVTIHFTKVLVPRIFINGQLITYRDTLFNDRSRGLVAVFQQYPDKTNTIEINDQYGQLICRDEFAEVTRPFQTITPCL